MEPRNNKLYYAMLYLIYNNIMRDAYLTRVRLVFWRSSAADHTSTYVIAVTGVVVQVQTIVYRDQRQSHFLQDVRKFAVLRHTSPSCDQRQS